MFRRLATVAPRSVGAVASPRIAPAISGIQSQPINRASPTPQRRNYHEKDKYIDQSGMTSQMLTFFALLGHYNNPRNGMFAILICYFSSLISLEASMGGR